MINITGVDLAKFAQAVYARSIPVGMGFLHARGGGLTDEDAKSLVNETGYYALSMDYVHGRQCKMTVYRKDGKLQIYDSWHDHSAAALDDLLTEFNIPNVKMLESSND